MVNKQNKYELICYGLAKKAFQKGEVPVGAIIVYKNKIIAKAFNRKERTKIAINHAEIIAITKACKNLKTWRLENCEMFVTLKPCPMCVAALIECRIGKVTYLIEEDSKAKNRNITLQKAPESNISGEYLNLLSTFFKKVRSK